MDAIYAWIRNLIFGLCLLELFCHLVRNDDYRRYIRFFGGLVVLLLVFEPAGKFFFVDVSFDEALRRAFARQEAYELQNAQEVLAGLQNRQISEAYRTELTRQMKEIIKANGRQSISVEIDIEQNAGHPMEIIGVDILLMRQNSNLNVFEKDTDPNRQQNGISDIRDEISSVYGVDKRMINISVKE